jgi:antitoxin ParD1/3/4
VILSSAIRYGIKFMNISITPELEKFVQAQVASGKYKSASELVCDALCLLIEREELRFNRLEELSQEIQVGVDQARNGSIISGEESQKRMSAFKQKCVS